MNQDISGLWPAMLTPVGADGSLDTARAIAHAQHMLAKGCDGITLFGTTSEGPAFTTGERKSLLESMLHSGIRADQIVVTTTCSALSDAIDLGRHAIAQGCFRQLFMPPFYFRQPRDAGIMASVSAVVNGIGDPRLKLLLYHIPALSSVVFTHDSVRTLAARHPGQVIGVKDSSGSLEHGLALARAFPQLAILSGAEQYVAEIMRAGGSGSINGLSNIAPALMARIVANPTQVSPADEKLVLDLLALLSLRVARPAIRQRLQDHAGRADRRRHLAQRARTPVPARDWGRTGGPGRLPRHRRATCHPVISAGTSHISHRFLLADHLSSCN